MDFSTSHAHASPFPVGFHWQAFSALVSPGAAFDSQERRPAPRCLPETRTAILEEIEGWIDAGTAGEALLWLHAPAGAGKSAIAQTIAETCAKRGQLAASFFFSRQATGRNTMKHLFPTIIMQLALSSHDEHQKLDKILKDDPYIIERDGGSVDLIVRLLDNWIGHHCPSFSLPLLAIIDGLDECQHNRDQSLILEHVRDMVSKHQLPLRFLIFSRPEPHIYDTFNEHVLRKMTKVMSVYGDYRARNDVQRYLRTEFTRIHDSPMHKDIMCFISKPWPSDDIIRRLVDKSGGYFIYASTVIQFIDEEYFSCTERLDQVLGTLNNPHSDSDSTPFAELDKLYIQVLSTCPRSRLCLLKNILGFLLFAEEYAELCSIEQWFGLERGQVRLTLRGLHSIIIFLQERGITLRDGTWLRSIHASFLDFLLDPDRSKDYHVYRQQWYETAFCRSFSTHRNFLGSLVDAGNDDRYGLSHYDSLR